MILFFSLGYKLNVSYRLLLTTSSSFWGRIFKRYNLFLPSYTLFSSIFVLKQRYFSSAFDDFLYCLCSNYWQLSSHFLPLPALFSLACTLFWVLSVCIWWLPQLFVFVLLIITSHLLSFATSNAPCFFHVPHCVLLYLSCLSSFL